MVLEKINTSMPETEIVEVSPMNQELFITAVNADIIQNKQLRKGLDAQLQVLKTSKASRERALAITKLQEAIMWLGMDLKRLNESLPPLAAEPSPYPSSYDESTPKVEPTADGLTM